MSYALYVCFICISCHTFFYVFIHVLYVSKCVTRVRHKYMFFEFVSTRINTWCELLKLKPRKHVSSIKLLGLVIMIVILLEMDAVIIIGLQSCTEFMIPFLLMIILFLLRALWLYYSRNSCLLILWLDPL